MALNIRSKLPATGTTNFTVISALAQRHDAVNLGQGFPEYAIDPALIDLVDPAMRAGHNQYPLMPGVMRLREAIAAKVARLYGRGSYFQLARYRQVSDEPAQEFAQRLVREFGVATIPLSAFYQDGTDHRVIRFCFAKREQTLLAAAERLRRL